MAITVQDVITEEYVRENVEQQVEEDLIWRRVFDTQDVTGINSDSYKYYVEDPESDNFGPTKVNQGAEPMRHESGMTSRVVEFDKYMDEVTFTWEAQEDGLLDVKARQVDDMGRAMDEFLNRKAFEAIQSSDIPVVGDGDDDFTFNDIMAGIEQIRAENYTPNLMIMDLSSYVDWVVNYSGRETAGGDAAMTSGDVGNIAGMSAIVDNTRSLVGDGGPGAAIFDTTKFGNEFNRTPVSTNTYTSPERQVDAVQMWVRKQWDAVWPKAGVIVDA